MREVIIDGLRKLAIDAEKAAKFYEEKPDLKPFQPATTVDIYRAISRLAVAVEQLASEPQSGSNDD